MRLASIVPALVVVSWVTACDADMNDVAVPDHFIVRVENIGDRLVASDGTEYLPAFSPGVWAVDDEDTALFLEGEAASPGLETQCEQGDPQVLFAELEAGGSNAGFYPVEEMGSYLDGPILPGDVRQFEVVAQPGEHLSLVGMYGQSNDICVVLDRIAMFDPEAIDGEMTDALRYFDAGTELNEEPGIGPNQPSQETTPGSGMAEDGTMSPLEGDVDAAGFRYPAISEYLKLTVEPVF